MNANKRIRLELFLRKLGTYTIILLAIFTYAFLLGKEKETLFLMISYTITRNMFDKQLHCTSTAKCIKLTLIIFFITITAIIHYNASILECLLLGVMINYVGYVYMMIPFETIKRDNKRSRILKAVRNNEEEIDKLCKDLCIIELSETVYLYLNNTIEDTADILDIDPTTVTRRINKFLKAVQK